jgi:hypothetical protein
MSEAKSGGTKESGPPRSAGRLREIGRSLAHRNFRLFFAGQTVSLLGTWMQQTAMTWLVFRLTQEHHQNSALLLGVTGFAGRSRASLATAGIATASWLPRRCSRCCRPSCCGF